MNLIKTNLIKTIVVMALFVSAPFTALASLTNPEDGKEYQTLAKVQPTEATGKVEVTEFFFYTCPHCNVLDPYLSAWVKKTRECDFIQTGSGGFWSGSGSVNEDVLHVGSIR